MRQLWLSVEGVTIAFAGLVGFVIACANVWWVKQFLVDHPKLGGFIHSGWSVLALFVCAVVVYLIQKQLKRPSLRVKMVSAEWHPRAWDVPIGMLGELIGAPPRDEQKIDCDLIAELQVVNETDVPVSIGDFEAVAIIDKKKTPLNYVEQMTDYKLHEGDDFVDVPALMDKVRGISLNKGIPYRGWVRFEAKELSHKQAKTVNVEVWVLDTLDGKHGAVCDKRKPINQESKILPVLNRR